MVVEVISGQTRPDNGEKERVTLEQLKGALDLVAVATELHPSLKRAGSNLYLGGHDRQGAGSQRQTAGCYK